MNTKHKLAVTTFKLLRVVLESSGISWEEGIQHGGGTINTEQLCCGDLEVAITLKGDLEVVDRAIDITELFDLSEDGRLAELVETLRAGQIKRD